MARGKSVWALFAALAAVLLALQLFTHAAPMAAAHGQDAVAAQGEVLVCDDAHGAKETSQHFLTRQRSDEHSSDGGSSGAHVLGSRVGAASSAYSSSGHVHRQPRLPRGVSPATLQVFRC